MDITLETVPTSVIETNKSTSEQVTHSNISSEQVANSIMTETTIINNGEQVAKREPQMSTEINANSINNALSIHEEKNGEIRTDTNVALPVGYSPSRETSYTSSDARFDPLKADANITALQSAATKQAIVNAKQQSILAQKLKQINPYTWPGSVPMEQQPYGMFYPMGWPVDTDYSAYVAGLTAANQAFANPQQTMAINPGLTMGLNPLVNQLVNPLVNPFANTLQTAFTAGIPDGKQHALFVFHLPEDVDDQGLLQLFAPYGAIRANVMRQDDGRTKGFGFVHFNNRHDASIAIEMMNGHQIGRKRLMVSFKKNKDEAYNNNQVKQKPPVQPQ